MFSLMNRLNLENSQNFEFHPTDIKVGCVFPMVVVSIPPHAEFGPNDHREHPTLYEFYVSI